MWHVYRGMADHRWHGCQHSQGDWRDVPGRLAPQRVFWDGRSHQHPTYWHCSVGGPGWPPPATRHTCKLIFPPFHEIRNILALHPFLSIVPVHFEFYTKYKFTWSYLWIPVCIDCFWLHNRWDLMRPPTTSQQCRRISTALRVCPTPLILTTWCTCSLMMAPLASTSLSHVFAGALNATSNTRPASRCWGLKVRETDKDLASSFLS